MDSAAWAAALDTSHSPNHRACAAPARNWLGADADRAPPPPTSVAQPLPASVGVGGRARRTASSSPDGADICNMPCAAMVSEERDDPARSDTKPPEGAGPLPPDGA